MKEKRSACINNNKKNSKVGLKTVVRNVWAKVYWCLQLEMYPKKRGDGDQMVRCMINRAKY